MNREETAHISQFGAGILSSGPEIFDERGVVQVREGSSEEEMAERVESFALTHGTGAVVDAVADEASSSYLSAEEQQLLVHARAGQHRALRQLYNAYHGQVRAHLYRVLGPDCEIDDLTQIVFARAFNALHRFQGNSTLGTWLYRITANTTHNLLRQRFRRDRVKTALSWFNAGRAPGVGPNRVEARDEAHRILQRLRPDLREVFVLYHYEGLTLQEISNILEMPVSTVGDRLTRARKKLRDLVAS
jgi:RNA polymerase sigma-70 factor (ECF subfamily)